MAWRPIFNVMGLRAEGANGRGISVWSRTEMGQRRPDASRGTHALPEVRSFRETEKERPVQTRLERLAAKAEATPATAKDAETWRAFIERIPAS